MYKNKIVCNFRTGNGYKYYTEFIAQNGMAILSQTKKKHFPKMQKWCLLGIKMGKYEKKTVYRNTKIPKQSTTVSQKIKKFHQFQKIAFKNY